MTASGRAGTLLRDGVEVGPVRLHPRPKIYDLETADGVPYWKIALMHLDSLASTVFQRCVYWGTDEQCHFCAIGTSLPTAARSRSRRRRCWPRWPRPRAPGRRQGRHAHHRLAEPRRPRGALHGPLRGGDPRGRAGCRCRCSSSRPTTSAGSPRSRTAASRRSASTSRRSTPRCSRGSRRASTPRAATTTWPRWEAAVEVFGPGQVSTYFILGLGESPESVHGGLPGGHRARRLPVRRAAAPGAGEHRGRPACRPRPSTCAASTSRWRRCWPRPG